MDKNPAGLSRRSILEVLAVLLTGVLHFVFVDGFHLKGLFIALVTLLWGVYIIVRLQHDQALSKQWGFSSDIFLRLSWQLALCPRPACS
jgi:hypothetical protein